MVQFCLGLLSMVQWLSPKEQVGPPNNKHWRDKLNFGFINFSSNEYYFLFYFYFFLLLNTFLLKRIFQKCRMSHSTVFQTLKHVGIEMNLYSLWHRLCLRFVELLFCHDILWKSVTRDVPVIDKVRTLCRNVVARSLRTRLCINRVDELGLGTYKYMTWYDTEQFQPWEFFSYYKCITFFLWFILPLIIIHLTVQIMPIELIIVRKKNLSFKQFINIKVKTFDFLFFWSCLLESSKGFKKTKKTKKQSSFWREMCKYRRA